MVPQFINTTSDLLEAITTLQNKAVLFIDTEFIRERTYFPVACLLQIYSDGDTAYLIDLRSDEIDIAPLLDLLKNQQITKVLHSGRQDLEIFYNDFGFLPTPLFDTQIAASFLGYGDQISFEALVKDKLDIQIDKSQQRTDWRKRPLNEKQMLYAASDVYYLAPVYHILNEELEKQGRTEWTKTETQKLLMPDLYTLNEKDILKKVKHRIYQKESLAVLSALALWREKKAIERNQVRSKVISDEILINLSENKPKDKASLEKIRKLSETHINKYGHIWLEIIHNTLENIDNFHFEKAERLDPHLEKLHNLLNLYTKQAADDLNISPKLLASSADLTAFLQNKYDAFMHDWRFDVYGCFLSKIINGEVFIKYNKEKTKIELINN